MGSGSEESEVFIGRQPIFDRGRQVVGYEILFRAPDPGELPRVDPERATATVVLNALTEIGLDRIVGAHMAWINVTRETVLSGVPQMLPPGATGVELLEGQEVDETLVDALRELKALALGYRLAVDDFEFSPEHEPLLEVVDVIKLDFLALGIKRFGAELERLRRYRVKVLAEKVEDVAAHEYCLALGCDLFGASSTRSPRSCAAVASSSRAARSCR